MTATINASELQARIDSIPRFPLALRPTPLESLPHLARAIDLASLLVKRDDLTGLAFGGNKVRELEFFIGDALIQGCDVFIAGGGVGDSNHARQCTAAAVRAGLEPVMVLRSGGTDQPVSGNLLITELLGARLEWVDDDLGIEDRESLTGRMEAIASAFRRDDRRPYVLRSSFHPLGAIAYVECGLELASQLGRAEPATIFVTSMGATHVGLALAAALLQMPWRIVGVGWRPLTQGLAARLNAIASSAATLLGLPSPLTARAFVTLDHGGPRYGVASPASEEAWHLAARTTALLLDPVYTAKGMAGLISEARAARIAPGHTVFVHTGGLPAIFTHATSLQELSARRSTPAAG